MYSRLERIGAFVYRDHEVEARIIERLEVLGVKPPRGQESVRVQAAELRRLEAFVQDEMSLPTEKESFGALMHRARRQK